MKSLLLIPLLSWSLFNSPVWKTGYRETLTADEKVAGLALLWSETKYNFANFDLVPGLDWDAQFAAYVPRVRATKSTAEYYRVLQELLAKVHDGHTYCWPPKELGPQVHARPPLRTRLIENKVVVVRVDDPSLGIRIGDELLQIDGVPVRDYAEARVRPYVFASTPQDSDNRTYWQWLLAGSESQPAVLTFRDAGEKTVKRTIASTAPPLPLLDFRVLEGNVGYLALNAFHDEKVTALFDEKWDEIAKTSALIIDIRENGGGNTSNGYHILETLANKPFLGSKWRTRKYLPSHRAWNREESWDEHEAPSVEPDGKRHYTKPVVVLIGERTFSAAEDFAVAFDNMDRGLFIGGPTGGSTGQPLLIDLPGGGVAGICTKRDSYPDGRDFIGKGVQPDLAVSQTIEDLRAGKDAVLLRALANLQL